MLQWATVKIHYKHSAELSTLCKFTVNSCVLFKTTKISFIVPKRAVNPPPCWPETHIKITAKMYIIIIIT